MPALAPRVTLIALPGIPVVGPDADVHALIQAALERAELTLRDGDILVVTSKLISRAEGRFVDLAAVAPSARATELSEKVEKDPRLVELVLRESVAVSRAAPGVLIVRHRHGFVSANAAIDASNATPPGAPPDSGPWVLLMPEAPDDSAAALRKGLEATSGATVGVILSDSLGRPFRLGTVGAAVGASGLPTLWDQRGTADLGGRVLEHTVTALADQLAAAADMVAGQAGEGRPVVLIRGVSFTADDEASAADLLRPCDKDLYA